MGKVPLYLIAIGLVFLVPAVILLVSVFASAYFPSLDNVGLEWFNGFVRVIVIGVLFVIAFVFLGLGLLIAKRDKE